MNGPSFQVEEAPKTVSLFANGTKNEDRNLVFPQNGNKLKERSPDHPSKRDPKYSSNDLSSNRFGTVLCGALDSQPGFLVDDLHSGLL